MQKLAVLGTGTMGQGIAQLAATCGFETRVFDVDEKRVAGAIAAIGAQLDKLVQKGKLDAGAKKDALARLVAAKDVGGACSGVDVVVEAVPEHMELKVELFRAVIAASPAGALLGSNTSSLSHHRDRRGIGAPERTVGLHFFNPPPVMELLEVVRGLATSQDARRPRARARRVTRQDADRRERHARLRLEPARRDPRRRGDPHARVRRRERGRHRPRHGARLPPPDGPAQADRSRRPRRAPRDPRAPARARSASSSAPPPLLRQMVRAGKLGKKTGEGFYVWKDGQPVSR